MKDDIVLIAIQFTTFAILDRVNRPILGDLFCVF